jgi:hypothetical protein
MKALGRMACSLLGSWRTPPLLLLLFFSGLAGACAQDSAAVLPVNCENSMASSHVSSAPVTSSMSAVPISLQSDLDLVRASSYPELANKVVKTRMFTSPADYFRTRISISRFLLLMRMHYFVEMNPRIAAGGPSQESVCAILAHELVHIKGISAGNRIRLLGLVRLASTGSTARFERAADLEAIRRGYAAGLVTYREWVYKNIPATAIKQKRRNYFSPEEITAILRMTQADPTLFAYWKKHVPLNLEQINEAETTRAAEGRN